MATYSFIAYMKVVVILVLKFVKGKLQSFLRSCQYTVYQENLREFYLANWCFLRIWSSREAIYLIFILPYDESQFTQPNHFLLEDSLVREYCIRVRVVLELRWRLKSNDRSRGIKLGQTRQAGR